MELPTSHGDANTFPTDGKKTCEGKDQGVDDNSNGKGDDENDVGAIPALHREMLVSSSPVVV